MWRSRRAPRPAAEYNFEGEFHHNNHASGQLNDAQLLHARNIGPEYSGERELAMYPALPASAAARGKGPQKADETDMWLWLHEESAEVEKGGS